MTAVVTESDVDRREPWLGLASYRETDAELFFGRNREALELLRLVRREVLTVLFGPSGTGKTSLLNAGLFPRLRESGFLPVTIRLNHAAEGLDYLRQVRTRVDEVVRRDASGPIEEQALAPSPTDADQETLWEYLHRVVLWDPRNNPVVLVLVFDQFEEIFTLGRNRAATDAFLEGLSDLVENYIPPAVRSRIEARGETLPFPHDRPSCKVVVSLREDFVWRLDGLRKSMPSVMHNRFTVARMNGEQAVLVVREPGRGIAEGPVAGQIVRFVAAANQSRTITGEDVGLDSLQVDPALLSVVCRELNARRIEQHKQRITADLLEQSGTNILNDFYEHAFAGLSTATRTFVEDRLLTASGFRSTVPLEEAAQAGIAADEIERLVDRRLIRTEERLGIPHLELSHDLLTKVVQKSRADRKVREQLELDKRQREVEERKLAEQEARRQGELRRARQLLAVVSVAALICLLLGLSAFVSYRRAVAATKDALTQQTAASLARDDALRDKGIAEKAENSAKKNEAIATDALARADAKERANRQLLYVSRVGLARRASEQEEYQGAREVLSRYVPGKASSQAEDPRDFAWYYVWRLTPGGPMKLPQREGTRQVAFSGNGRILAVRENRGVVLWRTSSLKEPVRLDLGSTQPTALAISPDGETLAIGSREGVTLWNISASPPRPLPGLDGPAAAVRAVVFSPDGSLLAVGAESVMLWNVQSRASLPLEGPPLQTAGFAPSGGSVAFSPDGSTLAVCTDTGVTLVDLQHRRERRTLDNSEPSVSRCSSVAFSRSGRVAASGGNWVRLWEAGTGAILSTLRTRSTNVLSVTFSPDDTMLAASGADRLITLWDADTFQELTKLDTDQGNIFCAAFSPDGKTLATAGASPSIYLWDLRRWQERYALKGHSSTVTSVTFFPDGKKLVTGSSDDTAKVWDPISRQALATIRGHGDHISSVAVSPSGRIIATGGGKFARLWEAASAKELASFQRADPKLPFYDVKSVAFSADGTMLAVADAWAVTLWDVATRRELEALPGKKANGSVVTFSRDGALLAATGSPVRMWDVRSRKELPALSGKGEPAADAIALSPDGQFLAVGTQSHTIRLWSLPAGRELGELKGHSSYLASLAFSPDGKTLASSSADESIKLWDTSSWQELITLKDSAWVTSVAFSPLGDVLASGSFNWGVKLWYAASDAEVHGTPRTTIGR
jgi:WD40 repeat protein